ncbi:MAG: CHAD domain-containing protein [Candidatus Eisenbacteria bacterium]
MLHHPAVTAARLVAELSARTESLLDAARRVRVLADDEAIHDLRVADRRLAETLSLWRAALDDRPARRARRSLARLRRRLGLAREREVHLGLLRALEADAPPLAAEGARLLRQRLDLGLARARSAAARTARQRRLARILRRVERAGAGLAARVSTAPGLVSHAAGRAARRLADARAALARAAREGDDETLHAARLCAKKARYALESLAAVGIREDEAAVSELRKAQRRLGEAHDWATLGDRVRRVQARRVALARRKAFAEFQGGDEDAALAALLASVDERRAAARYAFGVPASGADARREAGA